MCSVTSFTSSCQIDRKFLSIFQSVAESREGLLLRRRMGRRLSFVSFFVFLGTGLNFGIIVTLAGKKNQALPIPIWTPFSQVSDI